MSVGRHNVSIPTTARGINGSFRVLINALKASAIDARCFWQIEHFVTYSMKYLNGNLCPGNSRHALIYMFLAPM